VAVAFAVGVVLAAAVAGAGAGPAAVMAAAAVSGMASAAARAPAPAPPLAAGGVVVAKLVWGDEPVERTAIQKESWSRLRPSEPIRTGERIRTSSRGVARLDFPWMAVTLGPSSELVIPARVVLSTVLEKGRAEFAGEGRDIVKIEIGRGEVRGGGRLVLWREGSRTAATALAGAFRVSAEGRTVEIRAGQGTVVSDGQPPAPPSALPAPPTGLVPGADPVYVPSGRKAELYWSPGKGAHHVQVLALRSDDVLLAREIGAPPARIEIPWVGTYRWQVSVRDGRGLESPPSAPGFICVVDK
jgi:hypothetical protein